MKVNNIDIAVFGAKQLKVDIQTSNVIVNKELLPKSLNPIFISKKIELKNIKVDLLFEGDNRDKILKNISNLASKITEETTLNLDGYSNNYICYLVNKNTEKTISKKKYKVSLDFEGYEVGNEVIESANRVVTKTINVIGNTETTAIVEITPSIDIIDIAINGLGEVFTIKNLKQGQKVIINGEACTVTQDGINKFIDTDLWEFPYLKAGANTLTFSKNNCDITIKYKPRWI